MGMPTHYTARTPDCPSAPILPLQTENGTKPLMTNHKRHRGRGCRACLIASACCLLTLFILLLVIIILSLTFFKVKDPKPTILSITVDGLASGFSMPVMQLRLNITLEVQIAVYNPNHASFKAGKGKTDVTYRGVLVGTADIEPASIPQRGTAIVSCRVTILADAFGQEILPLTQDALAGTVEMDASPRIRGRVKVLGFIKKSVVAKARCTIIVGFPDLKVTVQRCSEKTTV